MCVCMRIHMWTRTSTHSLHFLHLIKYTSYNHLKICASILRPTKVKTAKKEKSNGSFEFKVSVSAASLVVWLSTNEVSKFLPLSATFSASVIRTSNSSNNYMHRKIPTLLFFFFSISTPFHLLEKRRRGTYFCTTVLFDAHNYIFRCTVHITSPPNRE